MKHIIFILSTILSITSYAQDHNFKYQGEMPKYSFNEETLENGKVIFTLVTTDSVAPRNRIYLHIDGNQNLFINAHSVSLDQLETAFSFVLNNPEQLSHLPTSINDAVIYFTRDEPINRNQNNQTEIDAIYNGLMNVFVKFYIQHHPNEKGQTLSEINQTAFTDFIAKNIKMHFIQNEDIKD